MIIENISKIKLDLRKEIRENLKLLPWYIISKWCIMLLGGILFFYIEECYHYVPVTDTKTILCRELCQNIINDLFINETVIPTPTTMTNGSNSSSSVFTTKNTLQNNTNTTGNYTLMVDNTTATERLITSCIEKQCLQGDVSTGPTCSLSTDPNLLMKWMSFSFVVIFTIGR